MRPYGDMTALEHAQAAIDMEQAHYNKCVPAQSVHGTVDSLILEELAHLEAMDPAAQLHFTVDSAPAFVLQQPAADGINYPSLDAALGGTIEDYVLVDYWTDPLLTGLVLRFLPRHDDILRAQVLHHMQKLDEQEKAILTPDDCPDDEDGWFEECYGSPTAAEANHLATQLVSKYAIDVLVDGIYQLYLERNPGAGEVASRYYWDKGGSSKLRLRFIEIETDQKVRKTTYQQDATSMIQTIYS